jgi:uncharacterized membrane protein YbhN (UPF0104 family)
MKSDSISRRAGQWFRWFSLALGVAAFAYVAVAAVENWPQLAARRESTSYPALVLPCVAILVSLSLLAYAWHWVILRLGINVALEHTLYAWFTSNIYKYVPGQFWAPVGRAMIGAKLGIPARATALTFGIEQIFSILSSAVILFATLGQSVVAGALALLSLLLVHPRPAGSALAFMNRVLKRNVELVPLRTRQLAVLLTANCASLLLSILALCGVLHALGVFQLSNVRGYATALTASLLGGMLFLGAPAGLGVREGILLVGLTRSGVLRADASVAALLLRFAGIVVDALCFAAIAAVVRWRPPRDRTEP